MSEKSELNKYCQKNKLSLPKYKSWSQGQSHKLQWFSKISVYFGTKKISFKSIAPCNSKTAAEAQVAAIMLEHIRSKGKKENLSQLGRLYNSITASNASGHKSLFEKRPKLIGNDLESDNESIWCSEEEDQEDKLDPSMIKKIYLIDLENKPQLFLQSRSDSLYLGFIGTLHHSLIKYSSWHLVNSDSIEYELNMSNSNKLLYQIDGGTKDLVDHFLSAFLYPLVAFTTPKKTNFDVYIVTGDNAGWCTRACLEKIVKWRKITNLTIHNCTRTE